MPSSRVYPPFSSSPSTAASSLSLSMSPGLSVSLPSPTASSSYSFTPASTPVAQSHSFGSSASSSVFHFRSSSIAPLARPSSPLPTSPFQVLDEEDEERMRAIQQLAKRRRSSLMRADSTSQYSVPSPKAASSSSSSSLHASFAQLSLRSGPAQTASSPSSEQQSAAAAAMSRVPVSARRLFSLEVGSEGRESSRSSRKGSLKRAHDDDEDDYSQQRTDEELSGNNSHTAHVEEEHKQQEADTVTIAAGRASVGQSIHAASNGWSDKRTLRERPRRWTTGVMALQQGRATEIGPISSDQTRAARPTTPFVGSGVQPVKPVARSALFLHTDADGEDSGSTTAFSFDMPAYGGTAGKRASLTSSFLPLPPQSRPPTPLAATGKRNTLPATFRLSSLASLAESISARTDDDDDDDDGDERGGGHYHDSHSHGPGLMDERQQQTAAVTEKSTSALTWSSALPPVGADLRSTRAGSNEGRRRSLAMAGARALVGGAQF